MSPARRPRTRSQLVIAVAVAVGVVVVLAVMLSGLSPKSGYDISFPQCSAAYPSSPLFAIVGVNGGLAENANPCLGGELSWAQEAPGQKLPEQASVSLYIDTGNPGDRVTGWPKGGKTSIYGSCNGLLTNACSYLYGEQRASYSYHLVNALDAAVAKTAPWWLDVELMLSWAGTYQLNVAALQGYMAGLQNSGATGSIGVYSTSAQWGEITGLTAQTTSATFKRELPVWVAGTGQTQTQAGRNCSSAGFTGVAPTLVQYQTGRVDGDLRCSSTH